MPNRRKKRTPVSETHIAQIRSMSGEKMAHQIAAEIGLSAAVVCKYQRLHGMPRFAPGGHTLVEATQ